MHEDFGRRISFLSASNLDWYPSFESRAVYKCFLIAFFLACINNTSASDVFTDVTLSLVELDTGFVRQDDLGKAGFVQQIEPGLSREELIDILGNPEDSRVIDDKLNVEYFVEIPYLTGSIICQYKVVLVDERVDDSFWRRPFCNNIYQSFLESTKPKKSVSLSTDILFEFQSARLSLKGQEYLDAFSQEVHQHYENPKLIIEAHTDRIGTAEYNKKLSHQRAETIKSYLVTKNLPDESAAVYSFGEEQPLVGCDEVVDRELLIQCLSPNRRVKIVIR